MWGPLSQPYPIYDSSKRRWIIILGMGFFVYLFLLFFRPFGLNTIPSEALHFILIGYGLICSSILFIDLIVIPFLFPSIFKEEKWTVGKEIIYILWNISTIGLGNAFYTHWQWNVNFTIQWLLNFQFMTLMVAGLPVFALVLIKQITLLRKILKETHLLNQTMNHKKRLDAFQEEMILISAENPRDNLMIRAYDLMYINAADNYIEVHYLENGSMKKKLIRSSLKNARNDLRAYTAFYRCHRAWIVNLDMVKSITGNSQGYRLLIENSELQIPVSRNLNLEIGQRLAK